MNLRKPFFLLMILTLLLPGTPSFASESIGPTTSTPKQLSYVDVYYNEIFGVDHNSFNVDTGNYQLNYDLSNGGIHSLAIKNSSFPEASVLDAVYSLSPAVKVNGTWFRATNVNNFSTRDKMITRKAGKNMWEILLEGLQLADSQGNLLPLTVDQTFYFWNEKLYASTKWKPIVKITGIEYAELDTFVNADTLQSICDHVNVSQCNTSKLSSCYTG